MSSSRLTSNACRKSSSRSPRSGSPSPCCRPRELLLRPMPTSAQHWIRPTPLHRVTLAFSCAIVILIVVGALSYRSLVVSSETDRWVGHTHEVLANLDELNLGVADLEATSRGFVLTGFDADAAAVRASAAGAEAHEAAVRVLTRDNPRQQQRLPSLERLLAQNVQWAQSLVALRRTRGIDAAVAAARGGDGHRLGAAISAVTEQMRGEELRLLGLREGEARRISDQAKWVVALAALLGLLVTVAAAWSVRRDALRRTAAEAARPSRCWARTSRASSHRTRTGPRRSCDRPPPAARMRTRAFACGRTAPASPSIRPTRPSAGAPEAAPDAMVVVNQAGEIVLLNLQAEKQFGYSRDELIGQKVTSLIPEGYAERIVADGRRSAAEALAQQIGTGIELTGRRKDGSDFPIEIMLSPLENADGILVTAAIRDISVRNAAETHLAQMEGRYRGLLEAAPDAMVVVNQAGEIVLLNLQAEKQFGFSRDELIGQKVTSLIPEGFAERIVADGRRSAAEALAQQIGTGIELTGRRKDGSDFPIEIMLSPLENADGILVTAAIRDISVRNAAETHLAQMEGRYRGLLEAAPDAMVVVNQAGEIVLLNLQAEKQFGYSRDELIGQKVTSLIPEGFA